MTEKIIEAKRFNLNGYFPGFPEKLLIRITQYAELENQWESNKIEILERAGRKLFPLFYFYELWDSQGYVLMCRIAGDVKEEGVRKYIQEMFPLADPKIMQHDIQMEIKRIGANG
jgi:hypothetical protein